MAYSSGKYTLVGGSTPVTADAASNQDGTGPIVFQMSGAAGAFDVSSAVNSTVVVNQVGGLSDTVSINTNGGMVMAGTGILNDVFNVTINGGTYVTGTQGWALMNGAGSVGYGASGGTMLIGTLGTYSAFSETLAITGFTGPSDLIDDQSLNFNWLIAYTVTETPTGNETVNILDGSGNLSFTVKGANLATGVFTTLKGGPLTFSSDDRGGTLIGAVCFLAGTRLQTPDGETPVEALATGDLVAVRENGETVFRHVTWIGRRRMDAARAGVREAFPVRIRAGAFAEGAPRRDLLVTQEHCVFADGSLVPARMLVNGGSIVVDESVTQYEYFHVELERHAILVAEGLETESYLDTGNRGNFANAAVPSFAPRLAIDAGHDAWAEKAAAPLATDRETVEPLWRRLADRAQALGMAGRDEAFVSHDPEPRLVTDLGLEIRPSLHDGASYAFVVPGGARALRLVTRAARPSDAVGPFVDDRRTLGVKVGKIGVGVGRRRVTTDAALAAEALPGWHAREFGSAHRWTDGDAALPIDLTGRDTGPMFIDVEIVAAGPYPAREAAAALAA